ncbi:glycoside hydrolase family 97 protein [Filimonas effusa]|uniref:Glycoside hydrolase family 97 protein n=1 Tax=Filimonas effusa TaxID=2508721 RepID=A0A4Q1D8C2_9BACT|nr:glycoside hydrolase family 97 protein [Filimonas effusa]RXK85450.1 glycoside hydrolase family 97 protein [Filimonas effusa]
MKCISLKKYGALFAAFTLAAPALAKDYELKSPDKKITVNVAVGKSLEWSVRYGNETILLPSVIALQLHNNKLGQNALVNKEDRQSVNHTIIADVPVKSKYIADRYNELKLFMKGNYAVVFRAYDNGVAYRFEMALGDSVAVVNEISEFNFPQNNRVMWSGETNKEFQSHFESLFKDSVINAFNTTEHAALPLYMATPAGSSLLLSESDVYDYPNLFVFGTGGNAFTAGFPKVILDRKHTGDRTARITRLADYIAKTSGSRSLPWRYLVIGNNDKTIFESNLTFQLASPNVLANTAWIKPGKVAWDWWNANNIYGVDFKAGLNTETYKYYIDFASTYGLEYIVLDEGWSRTTTDIMTPAKEIDIKELVAYAASKNVGVILWALWEPLDKDLDAILDRYVQWGVKGIKVDFMARADQYMVNYYERVAAAAAKRQLLVDLHGAYKPVGLNRKYPNVLSYEGVRGLENCKWSEDITPGHDVTLPFTRMVAGPMDFTPGAMINATKKNFHITFTEPMSQGTRAHQVAMYVMYESPLQMLADNPSNYRKDPECTRFIAQIPTVWDTTIALHGKVGEYVAVARKNGDKWYVSAMTNWEARELDIPLDFLPEGSWKAQVLADGINAAEHAADYRITTLQVSRNSRLKANMSNGGGWCAVIGKE